MFASATRNVGKNLLRSKKKQKLCVLSILQVIKQLKNANSCIGHIFPEKFSEKYIFLIFNNIKGNNEMLTS